MNLCQTDNLFYSIDQIGLPHAGSKTYRIFSYQIVKYSDWLLPDSTRARGIMFEIDPITEEPIRLACLPMDKFFNRNETPITMDIDPNDILVVMDKMDGSIISQYSDGGYLRLKSNKSIQSDVAYKAMQYLETQPVLKQFLVECETENIQVNMEFISPDNQIVIKYPEDRLVILNFRDRLTGDYLDPSQLDISHVTEYMVTRYEIEGDMSEWLDNVRHERGIEGYVILTDKLMFKEKTDWYRNLHSIKSEFTSPKRIINNILYNQLDDARTLFVDDPEFIEILDRYEEHVVSVVNNTIQNVQEQFEKNRGKDAKQYALGYKGIPDYRDIYFRMRDTDGSQVHELVIKFYKKYPEKLIPERDKQKCLTL